MNQEFDYIVVGAGSAANTAVESETARAPSRYLDFMCILQISLKWIEEALGAGAVSAVQASTRTGFAEPGPQD